MQDNKAQNTREELQNASAVFVKEKITTVYFVTVPKHLPRVVRDVLAMKESGLFFQGMETFFIASGLDFEKAKVGDVAILEPPHRADLPSDRASLIGKGIINLLRNRSNHPQVYEEFEKDIISRLQKLDAM